MSHVIANKMLKAFTAVLRESIATEEFLNSLNDTELMNLVVAAEGNARDRKLMVAKPAPITITPEAQCEALRKQFGSNGALQLETILSGQSEPMAPVEYPFDLIRNELGDIVITTDRASMTTMVMVMLSEHFRSQGIIDGYRLGDVVYLCVASEHPTSPVMFHNRTTTKVYLLNSTLDSFARWFKQTIAIEDKNRQEFLSASV